MQSLAAGTVLGTGGGAAGVASVGGAAATVDGHVGAGVGGIGVGQPVGAQLL